MLRMGAVAIALSVVLLSNVPAHADFVLGSARPASIPANLKSAITPSPDLSPDAPEQAVPRFKMARGFGDAVPLSFAVRQIVPGGVRVHYGAGVDSESSVSWKGNQPWNQVLAVAVHPLHLRIVTETDTVLITHS